MQIYCRILLTLTLFMLTLTKQAVGAPEGNFRSPVSIHDLSPENKLRYKTLTLILEDIRKEEDQEKKKELLEELLAQSEQLKEDAPRLSMIWVWRAEAALELGHWREGQEAAQQLIRLGALEDKRDQFMTLMAKLNRRGWLTEDTSALELIELKRTRDLREDRELGGEALEELTEIITQYATGDPWVAYDRLKVIRIQIGEEAFLEYPLARRAIAASLAMAAARGDRDTVRAAIACGGNPNARINGQSALLWAAYHADAEMVRLLLTAGADKKAKNKYGQSVLVEPVWKGSEETVRLLTRAGADPNVDGKEHALIYEAVEKGRSEIVTALIEAGADANARSGEDKQTPVLLKAIQSGDIDMAETLVKGGANPKLKYQGKEMLWYAKKQGGKDMYRRLKRLGR